MGKVSRRRHSREFKIEVLRELDSGRSIAELCREHDLHKSLISKWRREFEKNPSGAFTFNVDRNAARVEKLEKLVGQLYAENDFLKRALEALKKRDVERRDR
jgi:transposase